MTAQQLNHWFNTLGLNGQKALCGIKDWKSLSDTEKIELYKNPPTSFIQWNEKMLQLECSINPNN